jgi:hypothetical protein
MSIINSLMILLGNWNACPILKLEQIDTKQKRKATDSDPLKGCFSVFTRKGLNPYSDPDLTYLMTRKQILSKTRLQHKTSTWSSSIIEPEVIAIEEPIMTIKEAFEFALNIKKHSLNNTSYINFEGRINRFKNRLMKVNR